MKSLIYAMLSMALVLNLGACSTDQAPEATAQPSDSASTPASPNPTAPAPAATPAAPSTPPKPAASTPVKPSAPATFAVPEGTEVTVALIDSISTGKNKAGDEFTASLAEPIMVNGRTVAEKGVKVNGRIVDAEGAGRVSGKANIRLVLTSIADGAKAYPIVTKPFVAEAEATRGRDAGIIGGAAGVGAAIGAIAGGKSGAAKGAVIGGAAGTGTVLATRGKEVEFDSESRLKFTLEKSASLPKITS
jgi:hypothetical protein